VNFWEIHRYCTDTIVSINRQRRTYWPIYLFYWRTTTDSLTYFSRRLKDNDKGSNLFFSSFNGHRQTHWPIYLVYYRTTTNPLTYLSRLLTKNDSPIGLFFLTIVGQRHMHWPIFLPTCIKQSVNLGNIVFTILPRFLGMTRYKIHERFLHVAKLFSIDEVNFRIIDIHWCIIFLSYLTSHDKVLPVILGLP
jgi:hypothetical protein